MMSPPAPAAMIIQALYERPPLTHLSADTVYLYMSSSLQLKKKSFIVLNIKLSLFEDCFRLGTLHVYIQV